MKTRSKSQSAERSGKKGRMDGEGEMGRRDKDEEWKDVKCEKRKYAGMKSEKE